MLRMGFVEDVELILGMYLHVRDLKYVILTMRLLGNMTCSTIDSMTSIMSMSL